MTSPLPDLMGLSVYDEDLRQVAADPEAVRRARASARARHDAQGPDEVADRARLESYMGEAARIPGHHQDAIDCQQRAIAIAEGCLPERTTSTYRPRLAEAHRCAGAPWIAKPIMAAAVRATSIDPALVPLRHFARQHLGKCLTYLRRWDAALAALAGALAIRVAAGEPELIEGPRAAVGSLERRRSVEP